mgnify:CR=1 FL=1
MVLSPLGGKGFGDRDVAHGERDGVERRELREGVTVMVAINAAEHRDEYRALAGPDAIEEKAVWAGEASSFVSRTESASDVVRDLVASADGVSRERLQSLAPTD